MLAGACYAGFLLAFRAANRSLAPTAIPLLESTLGTVAGALLVAPFDPRFTLTPHFPAHAWLIVLAIVAQVIGWLLISTALPRLPAVDTSILLLGQPVLSLIWGVVIFGERLSAIQWAGVALVLGGVGSASSRGSGLNARDSGHGARDSAEKTSSGSRASDYAPPGISA